MSSSDKQPIDFSVLREWPADRPELFVTWGADVKIEAQVQATVDAGTRELFLVDGAEGTGTAIRRAIRRVYRRADQGKLAVHVARSADGIDSPRALLASQANILPFGENRMDVNSRTPVDVLVSTLYEHARNNHRLAQDNEGHSHLIVVVHGAGRWSRAAWKDAHLFEALVSTATPTTVLIDMRGVDLDAFEHLDATRLALPSPSVEARRKVLARRASAAGVEVRERDLQHWAKQSLSTGMRFLREQAYRQAPSVAGGPD